MKTILALALVLAGTPLAAHEFKSGAIHVIHPWTRETAPGQSVAGGYMTITNEGSSDDRLLGASSPAAARVQLHSMTMEGSIMKMRPVSGGLPVSAGGTETLAPGGLHLMLTGLRQPLVSGGMVPVTLRFAKAGSVAISLMVNAVSAPASEHMHDQH
jgi:copper(I)-binding protein